ncbi:MAG: dTDP-4-dehydrorhamnose reductase [Desulfobacterales bacterium]|nr:dTDP-4-dehydrorhamnose reductase [Desulfobacterales bacterium]
MIWLIGNKGMLGSEVETLLIRQKRNYVATDMETDITDTGQLKEFAAEKPLSWIINCAAYTAVDKAEDEPERAFKINADGPLNIAQTAVKKNARLIHISTDYVFDGAKEGAYLETDLPNPINAYGKSKFKGETNIAETMKAHFIIRSAWLYGKNGYSFVRTMLNLFKEKTEVKIVADQWSSPTYAADLAAAVIRIIDIDPVTFGIYHFTNEGRTNWHQFATEIYNLAGIEGLIDRSVRLLPVETGQYPTKAKRPANSCLSKEKISRDFNISLKPWKESLAHFISTLPLPNTNGRYSNLSKVQRDR